MTFDEIHLEPPEMVLPVGTVRELEMKEGVCRACVRPAPFDLAELRNDVVNIVDRVTDHARRLTDVGFEILGSVVVAKVGETLGDPVS